MRKREKFVDEIDSVLCERTDREQETTRRMKTQFLIEFDGVSESVLVLNALPSCLQVASSDSDRVLVMGATNRPFDLDDAVIRCVDCWTRRKWKRKTCRRFKKRIYIGLPDAEARAALLGKLLAKQNTKLPEEKLKAIAAQTEHYSYSDLRFVAEEAAMEPIRELPPERIAKLKESQVRLWEMRDWGN